MRKSFIVLFLLAVVVAAVIWWKQSGKETVKAEAAKFAPQIEISDLQITDIDDESINMTGTAIVQNNLPADVEIDSLSYKVFIDSVEILESRYPKALVLPKLDSTTIKLPIVLKTKIMKAVLKKFDQQKTDSADYTLHANFKSKIPIAGERDFEVKVTKRLRALRPIKIQPGDIDIKKLGLKESSVEMTVTVINPNTHPIQLKDAKYDVNIENDFEAEGYTQKLINIPAKGSETVSIQMNIKKANLPKVGWKMLFKDKKTNFDLRFTATLTSKNKILKNSRIKLAMKGTLDELKQLAGK